MSLLSVGGSLWAGMAVAPTTTSPWYGADLSLAGVGAVSGGGGGAGVAVGASSGAAAMGSAVPWSNPYYDPFLSYAHHHHHNPHHHHHVYHPAYHSAYLSFPHYPPQYLPHHYSTSPFSSPTPPPPTWTVSAHSRPRPLCAEPPSPAGTDNPPQSSPSASLRPRSHHRRRRSDPPSTDSDPPASPRRHGLQHFYGSPSPHPSRPHPQLHSAAFASHSYSSCPPSASASALPSLPPQQRRLFRVVLTGGPCGGKSTCLPLIADAFRAEGFAVYTLPEVATMLLTGGCQFPGESGDREHLMTFQRSLLEVQLQLEASVLAVAAATEIESVLVLDRAAMDFSAYLPRDLWLELLRRLGLDEAELRDRYDAVVHLRSASFLPPVVGAYTTHNNPARRDTPDESRALDAKVWAAWALGGAAQPPFGAVGLPPPPPPPPPTPPAAATEGVGLGSTVSSRSRTHTRVGSTGGDRSSFINSSTSALARPHSILPASASSPMTSTSAAAAAARLAGRQALSMSMQSPHRPVRSPLASLSLTIVSPHGGSRADTGAAAGGSVGIVVTPSPEDSAGGGGGGGGEFGGLRSQRAVLLAELEASLHRRLSVISTHSDPPPSPGGDGGGFGQFGSSDSIARGGGGGSEGAGGGGGSRTSAPIVSPMHSTPNVIGSIADVERVPSLAERLAAPAASASPDDANVISHHEFASSASEAAAPGAGRQSSGGGEDGAGGEVGTRPIGVGWADVGERHVIIEAAQTFEMKLVAVREVVRYLSSVCRRLPPSPDPVMRDLARCAQRDRDRARADARRARREQDAAAARADCGGAASDGVYGYGGGGASPNALDSFAASKPAGGGGVEVTSSIDRPTSLRDGPDPSSAPAAFGGGSSGSGGVGGTRR